MESRSSASARDGRALLLKGARQLLAEKGYAGMELRDVAERGHAPRGSIYHHFPGGKVQLAREAAELEGTTIRDLIERSLEDRGLRETLFMFGEIFRRRGQGSPRANRLPGRRCRPGAARGPRAGRGRHCRLPELGTPDCRGASRRRCQRQGRRGLRRPRRLDRRGRPAARPRRRQPGAARLGDRRPRPGS